MKQTRSLIALSNLEIVLKLAHLLGPLEQKTSSCRRDHPSFEPRSWNFTPFTISLIKKLRWWWKTFHTHKASISRVYKYLLSKQRFKTVFGPFLQIKPANMHRWNIFPIEALRMLASPQTYTGNLPIKSQAFLTGRLFCVGVALIFQFVWQNGRAASKACWLSWFILRIPKILRVLAQDVPYGSIVWKRTFYRNDDLSTTCQCRQLKLNRLSTQINTYCLWPIKRLRCRYNAVRERELQWCYYSPSIYLVPLPLQL